jgi:hypothetical protein
VRYILNLSGVHHKAGPEYKPLSCRPELGLLSFEGFDIRVRSDLLTTDRLAGDGRNFAAGQFANSNQNGAGDDRAGLCSGR